MTDAETTARAALEWAIDKTVLRLPPMLRQAGGWKWDADDESLFCLRDEEEFRFHVAAWQRGSRKVRIAVMSIMDDDGKATWEADMPDADMPTRPSEAR